MLLINRPGWALRESAATPEATFLDRRRILKLAGMGAVMAAAGPLAACDETPMRGAASGASAGLPDPSADLYPAARNDAYGPGGAITDEDLASRYNNFYEFGSHKEIWPDAQALPIRPWTVQIDGLVDKPVTIDIDDLLRRMTLEERIYRHRCVEAWSMVVPWTGFPLARLVALAEPQSGAKFVRFQTFENASVAGGQKQFWYPWPYVEGVTLAEATNDLAFMVTGAYGKPMANQFGAPLRLHLPWKYGFKSIKSIVRITFTATRPISFWEDIAPREYGFWANVNPDVPHPRWSQATERPLGASGRIPTQLFNGYGEWVAGLYTDVPKSERLFL